MHTRAPFRRSRACALAATVALTCLAGTGCGLDSLQLVGSWGFCKTAACHELASGGVAFRDDGTYVELYDITSDTHSYCESPADFAHGTYTLEGTALTVRAKSGKPTERTVGGVGDMIIITYAKVGLWDGGTFPLSRIPTNSTGACFDQAKPKASGERCTPTGMFHGNRDTPPTTPRIDQTPECQSGFCVTLACANGRAPSICAQAKCTTTCADTAHTCVPFNQDLGGGAYCLANKACNP